MQTPKKLLSSLSKFGIIAAVLAFMGLHSYNFFDMIFPQEQEFYKFLGFALTSGGVVAYAIILLQNRDPITKKSTLTNIEAFVAVAMMFISLFGELMTAIFGMEIEAYGYNNIQFSQTELNNMIYAVGALGFAHGLAAVAYVLGDTIVDIFQRDENNNGVPDILERKQKPRQQSVALAADTRQEKPKKVKSQ
jgi:hypothetical protein